MSEKKTKPKYSAVANVGWMIFNAWRECKSVLLLGVIIAVVSVALNLTELFIAPQILQRVENGAEVSSLLLIIAIFSGTLFLLMGLKSYFEDNSLYGRISSVYRTGKNRICRYSLCADLFFSSNLE